MTKYQFGRHALLYNKAAADLDEKMADYRSLFDW
jgi:hypothetical protein